MRELKFRVWDDVNFGTPQIRHFNVYQANLIRHIEKLKIMQYTGIKDKNGKEIYEGDILKGSYWENGKRNRIVGKVVYGGHSFTLKGVKKYSGINSDFYSEFEVLGNEYETPDLLEY